MHGFGAPIRLPQVFISGGCEVIELSFAKMKAYAATFAASSLSGLVLLGCFLAMWQIHSNIAEIYDELEEEMDGFKVRFDCLYTVF